MIRTDLLETLKEFLKTVPREKFNLSVWRDCANREIFISDDYLKNECGTVACAMGWAATLPEFKEAGLEYSSATICYTNPKDKRDGEFSFDAIKRVFKFHHHNTSKNLFSKLYYGSDSTPPDWVVSRIEYLLKLMELPEGVEMSEPEINHHQLKAEVKFIMAVSHRQI